MKTMTNEMLQATELILNAKYIEADELEADIKMMKEEATETTDFILEAEKHLKQTLGLIEVLQLDVEIDNILRR